MYKNIFLKWTLLLNFFPPASSFQKRIVHTYMPQTKYYTVTLNTRIKKEEASWIKTKAKIRKFIRNEHAAFQILLPELWRWIFSTVISDGWVFIQICHFQSSILTKKYILCEISCKTKETPNFFFRRGCLYFDVSCRINSGVCTLFICSSDRMPHIFGLSDTKRCQVSLIS